MTNQSINLDNHQESAPCIYVACLSGYNNGHLHGCWINANQEPEAIWQEINSMLANSPMPDAHSASGSDVGASEWAIHDYKNFHGLFIDEQHDIEELSLWGELIAEHGKAIAVYISWAKDSLSLEVSASEFASRYCGQWENAEAFGLRSDEIEERYNWSGLESQFYFWSTVIDWEKVGLELELSDAYYYADASPGIYVFRYR